jgi:hypothetical protein
MGLSSQLRKDAKTKVRSDDNFYTWWKNKIYWQVIWAGRVEGIIFNEFIHCL